MSVENFDFLREWSNIGYVILGNVPNDSEPLRILVKPSEYEQAVNSLIANGYKLKRRKKKKYILNFKKIILNSIYKIIRSRLYMKEFNSYKLNFIINKYQNKHSEIHLYNHLAYLSPMEEEGKNRFIEVDPRININYIENRVFTNNMYFLSQQDYLIDKICDFLLNKYGNITASEEFEILSSYKSLKLTSDIDIFKEHLEWIFWDTSKVIIDNLENGKIINLKNEVLTYKDY